MDQTNLYNTAAWNGPMAPAAARAAVQPARSRIAVIDVLRGLIMLIMLFDHVREAIYVHIPLSDPLDAVHTDPRLFFTRIATHFCAPLFVFLTGLSAWLYAHPASGPRSATGFLVKRGLLLVFLELVVVNFAWYGVFPPQTVFLQVIWVIGLSMIFLGLVHKLPIAVLGAVGLAIIFGHNALTWMSFAPGTVAYDAWTLLLHRGYLVADGAIKVKVAYPLLPWIGVILAGYAAGPVYAAAMSPERRRRILVAAGVCALLLLALLRGFNIYGEELPWTVQDSAIRTVMSFLALTKYPPSLDYLLLTLGIGALTLAVLEPLDNWFTRACATFGGAPMFYYLLHLYVLLGLQRLLVATFGANHGARYGVDHVWLVWLVALALMPLLYFPCRAFARYKRSSKQAWVRYF